MIRGRERGGATSQMSPCHVFWFGGLCFTTACWSDEPRTIEYVGDDENAARATADAIEARQSAMVSTVLERILKRIDGGPREV